MSKSPDNEFMAFDEFRVDDPEWWERLQGSVISQNAKDMMQWILTQPPSSVFRFERPGENDE